VGFAVGLAEPAALDAAGFVVDAAGFGVGGAGVTAGVTAAEHPLSANMTAKIATARIKPTPGASGVAQMPLNVIGYAPVSSSVSAPYTPEPTMAVNPPSGWL
jgi:hypothetical protein